jgi:hypothetical protein
VWWILFFSAQSQARLPGDYESWIGKDKQTYLWEKQILPTQYSELPELSSSGWINLLNNFSSLDSLPTFHYSSDETPEGHVKLIHRFGTVANVEFVPAGLSGLTGIFESGAVGLIRFSLAADPAVVGYVPGIALKWFVDGQPSLNGFFMPSLEGQGNDDLFLRHTFKHNLPQPRSWMFGFLVYTLGLWITDPLNQPIDHWAEMDRSGQRVTHPQSPGEILLNPTEVAIRLSTPAHATEDFRTVLGLMLDGTPLFTIDSEGGAQVGQIVLRSQPTGSQYGDEKLFFRHRTP